MKNFQDAFISYGRADSKSFANDLNQRLMARGLTIWFDFDDIPLATDFQERIRDGIEKAHNFIYIISPSSVYSPYCDKELEIALACGKRIIPIMHVEEITRDTWAKRNPNNLLDADWQAFQATGQYRSLNKLNTHVQKLNWIFFREGIDSFEQSFEGLSKIFHDQHRDYIHCHTQFLNQALDWERNHRQTKHLLIGNERQQAEAWLKTNFVGQDPPCQPNTLQCEFITESIKNANNLMTQVFLCHADLDQGIGESIRQFLMRQGITVWNYRTDIQSSRDYNEAILQGIEAADNLVFLLSPHSAQSAYCQQELQHALELNKRVIPLQISLTPLEKIPEPLKTLQCIDFTALGERIPNQEAKGKLLRILNDEEAYYKEHKTWLIQAIKWEQQQNNPAKLLRGYNLRRAETWLSLSRHHRQPPTNLHRRFITESLRQPPDISVDVFISYSRVDSDFARKLNEELQFQGKRTWFDQESIASGTDFQQEIHRGIESSGIFLFVLSPESVNSPYCAGEVEHADKHNKRIVTVLYRDIDIKDLHPVLAEIQYLDFRGWDADFDRELWGLLNVLNTDRAHLNVHTKLLVQAIDWDSHQRDPSLLLRGRELEQSVNWISEADTEGKSPAPTALQRNFIFESGKHEVQEANRWKELYQSAKAARKRAEISELNALLLLIQSHLSASDYLSALESCITVARRITKVSHTRSQWAKLTCLLRESLIQIQEKKRIKAHYQPILDVHIQGDKIYCCSEDHSASIWTVQGKLQARLVGHSRKVLSVSVRSHDGVIATASQDSTIKLWNQDGNVIYTIQNESNLPYTLVEFSPDGEYLIASASNRVISIWDNKFRLLRTLGGHQLDITALAFSADVKKLASLDARGQVIVRSLPEFRHKTFHLNDSRETKAVAVRYGQSLSHLIAVSLSNVAIVLDEDGQSEQRFNHGISNVHCARASTYVDKLVCCGESNKIKVFSTSGEHIHQFYRNDGDIYTCNISPDGQTIVSAGKNGEINLWKQNSFQEAKCELNSGSIQAVSHVPATDGYIVVDERSQISIWNSWQKVRDATAISSRDYSSICIHPTEPLAAIVDLSTIHLWRYGAGETASIHSQQEI